MMARYDAKNPAALQRLTESGDVTLLPFPEDVMTLSEEASFELYDEFAASDTDFKSILDEWSSFRDSISAWHSLAEAAMLNYSSKS